LLNLRNLLLRRLRTRRRSDGAVKNVRKPDRCAGNVREMSRYEELLLEEEDESETGDRDRMCDPDGSSYFERLESFLLPLWEPSGLLRRLSAIVTALLLLFLLIHECLGGLSVRHAVLFCFSGPQLEEAGESSVWDTQVAKTET
jgi:hypothetical protein